MADIAIVEESGAVIVTEQTETVVVIQEAAPVVIEVVEKGPKGDPGDVASADMFFQKALRFSELSTPEAKAAARANLELQYIDGGTFN